MGFAELGESLRDKNRALRQSIRIKYFQRTQKKGLPGIHRRELPAKRKLKADEKRYQSVILTYCMFGAFIIAVLMMYLLFGP